MNGGEIVDCRGVVVRLTSMWCAENRFPEMLGISGSQIVLPPILVIVRRS